MANPPTNPNPDTQTDNGDDNPFGKMLAGFFGGNSNTQGQQQDPLSGLIALIMSFFKVILGIDDKGDGDSAPDRRPSDTQGQQEYDARQRAAAQARSDAEANFTPGNVRKTAQEMQALNQNAAPGSDIAIIPIEGGGIISSGFGHREPPKLPGGGFGSSEHQGLDIAPTGSVAKPNIIAPVDGVVMYAGERSGYGNTVDILSRDGKKLYRMAHLSQVDVKVGQAVHQRDKVGVMGTEGNSTGVHLHFEERDASGKPINPTLLGHHMAKLETFNANTNVAYLEAHRNDYTQLASNKPSPGGHGKLEGLSAMLNTPSPNYVAPNTGKKPVPQTGHTVG